MRRRRHIPYYTASIIAAGVLLLVSILRFCLS